MEIEKAKEIKTQEEARQFAIDWQSWSGEVVMSWGDLAEWGDVFKKLGKKFKLTAEFKENGII